MWLLVGAVGLAAVGALAWFYPFMRSRIAARWRARCFRAVARELGLKLTPDGRGYEAAGFMPTVAYRTN